MTELSHISLLLNSLTANDPTGMMLAIASILLVFVVFLLLFFSFRTIRHMATGFSQERAAKNSFGGLRSEAQLSGEVLAAISTAIYQMNENQHDIETTILTIQQVKRNYSPWSAKSQMLLKPPR
jgi:Na+-transporting methylmalonyl-CoA/oxaloacetate decarboxylase gamma subunit